MPNTIEIEMEEEEAEEIYHLQYLDGEIQFLEGLITEWVRKKGVERRYSSGYSYCSRQIEPLEEELANFYSKKKKFLIYCEKQQKERDKERRRLELERRENMRILQESMKKMEEAIKDGKNSMQFYYHEHKIKGSKGEDSVDTQDHEKVEAEISTVELKEEIFNELVDNMIEESDERYGAVLDVKEENISVPCELTLINIVLPSYVVNMQVDVLEEKIKLFPPIQKEIFEDELLPKVSIPDMNMSKIRGRIFSKEGEYDANQRASSYGDKDSLVFPDDPMMRGRAKEFGAADGVHFEDQAQKELKNLALDESLLGLEGMPKPISMLSVCVEDVN